MFKTILGAISRHARAVALVGGLGALSAGTIIPLSGFAANPTTLCALKDYQCVIKYGDQAISARLTSLNNLSGRVAKQYQAGHITSDNNTTLTNDISTNESGLNALKTKLDAETTAAGARADYKSIYTTYRIYAVVMPRDNHELWLDMLQHTNTRQQNNETDIANAIAKAPAGVQAQANQLFSDYKTQVTNAQAQLSAAQQIIPELTPDAFNTNPTGYKTTLDSYKTDIHSAAQDTKTAASDLHQIVELLENAK